MLNALTAVKTHVRPTGSSSIGEKLRGPFVIFATCLVKTRYSHAAFLAKRLLEKALV